MYGGNKERLKQLNHAAELRYNEFSKKDPTEVKAEVQKYAALVFPEQNKNINSFSSTQAPPKIIGSSGTLNIKVSDSGVPLSVKIETGPEALSLDDKKKEENQVFLRNASDILFGVKTKEEPKNLPLLTGRTGQVEQTGREKTIFKRDANGEFVLSEYGIKILANMDFADFVNGGLTKLTDNPITQAENITKDVIRRSNEFERKEKERIINFMLNKENRTKAISFFTDYLKRNPKTIKADG
jgi:hypothetical protein